MDKEIIEVLKKNEKPFGLMTDEMQKALDKAGMADCQRYSNEESWRKSYALEFYNSDTYRLRPDYEFIAPQLQEAEIVECEVDTSTELLAYAHPSKPDTQLTFSYALCCPDFIGFKYEDGVISSMSRRYKDNRSVVLQLIHKDLEYEALTPTHVLFANANA